jgi:spermidine synthase
LGAGTAARALNQHNVSLTIVELDPLVYQFARDYFGLHRLQLRVESLEPVAPSSPPVNSTHLHGEQIDEQTEGRDGIVYLEEARQWVQKRVRSLATGRPVTVGDSRFEKFDYVIHDVFSGGSVPAHLFSAEFWAEAKASLREDGVIAVVGLIHHRIELSNFNLS